MKDIVFFALCLLWVSLHKAHSYSADEEHRLRNRLLDAYDEARLAMVPRLTGSEEILNVSMGMDLIKIVDFDVESHDITIYGWDKLSWTDENLKWNPDRYGAIDKLRVPNDLMWKPDIDQFNTLDIAPAQDSTARALVYSSGNILFIPRTVHKTHCERKEDGDNGKPRFSCPFKFGSWTYSGLIMDLHFYLGLEKIDTAAMVEDTRFEVVGTKAVREATVYDCCPETYPSLTFTLELELKHGGSHAQALTAGGHRGGVSVVAFIVGILTCMVIRP